MSNLTKKIVAIVTTLTVSVWMLGPGVAHALTAAELQVQIDLLMAQIADLQAQLTDLEGETTGGAIVGVPADFTFETALKQGDSSNAVKYLQIVLNSDSATQLAASGVGSAGNETMYFGPLTKAAVVKFQEKYADDVLAFWGLTAGTGFVGSTTRAKLNELLEVGVAEAPAEEEAAEEEVAAVGEGPVTVKLAATTPADKQVAMNAQDAIAAKFEFYGGETGVTITKILVKRGGVSADADVSAIKLYDNNTTQLGSTQALNTNTHKAAFSGLSWNVPSGETKILTVKVTIASKGTATVGDSIKLGVVAASDITADATIEGTFPLYGNALTIAGISVGELFVLKQATPATTTILSGATDQEIASWKFTASSTEAVEVHSIKITHVGSAATNDISNIKLKISGVQIGSTIASLDSQNTATFDVSAAPISILVSANKTIYAHADVAGGIWTSRTIIFEITQYTDVVVYGANSGGSITPAETDTIAFAKQTGNTMTIGQGSLTINIDSGYNPASQTYVKGTTNRLFSAFKFTSGSREGVRVVKLKLKINNGNGSATDVSNVTLWDGTTQIAGPASVIGSYVTFGANTIGWDSAGLFDVAKSDSKTIQVKADIPSGATTNNTVDLDIGASTDVWIDGLESKYDVDQSAITLTSGNANTHTVSASGALALSKAADTPAAQTYIKGATAKEFLRVNLQADSGEDMTVSAITFDLKRGGAENQASGDLTNVKLLKTDDTQLGSTVASPSTEAAFSFSLTVPASETVTLKVIADVPSTTNATTGGLYMVVTAASDVETEGAASAATITETGFAVTGNTMAIDTGSLTIGAAAIPGDQNIIIGAAEIPVVGLIVTAGSAENVRVTQVKLRAASQDSVFEGDQNNLSNMALWEGSTRLTVKKGWDSSTATSVTFSASDFLNSQGIDITKGQQKTITVKADIPSTGTNAETITLGIASSSDTAAQTEDVQATGLSSNTSITPSLNYPSAIGGVNFSTSSAADASIAYITLKSSGTLTLESAADTPVTNIVTVGAAGRTNVEFLKVNFTAAREDMDIKSLVIDRAQSADTDFGTITLWDGSTQIGSGQTLSNKGLDNSSTTFNLPAGSYWRILAGTTKTLTVKADLQGSKTADVAGSTSGDAPQLCLASSTDAQGVSSGATITSMDTGSLCGNAQIVYKSKPTLAAASLPSTVFGAGEKVLYRWTVTADSKGDIGWIKAVFDVSGSVQIGSDTFTVGSGGGNDTPTATSTNGIYMGTSTTANEGNGKQLIATSTLKVYNVATGVEVNASTGSAWVGVHNFLAGGSRVTFWADSEQVIAAGETKTYELRGDILYGGKAGDSISTKISTRNTATSTSSLYPGYFVEDPLLGDDTSTTDTFVWTDRSGAGATHSGSTNDWSRDYKVSGLSTATLSLSK